MTLSFSATEDERKVLEALCSLGRPQRHVYGVMAVTGWSAHKCSNLLNVLEAKTALTVTLSRRRKFYSPTKEIIAKLELEVVE